MQIATDPLMRLASGHIVDDFGNVQLYWEGSDEFAEQNQYQYSRIYEQETCGAMYYGDMS